MIHWPINDIPSSIQEPTQRLTQQPDLNTEEPRQYFTRQSGAKGSNPGGIFKSSSGDFYYIKSGPIDKVRGEVLASQLYEAAKVYTSHVKLHKKENGELVITSKWIDNLQTFSQSKLMSNVLNRKDLVNINGLYENFVIDCWLNNWDVVGLAYDNLSLVDTQVVRIDTGGALDFRAKSQSTKSKSFGKDAFSAHVNMLLEAFTKNRQMAHVFAGTTIEHFNIGVQKLKELEDSTIYNLIMKIAPGTEDDKIDLFMKMLERKHFILQYSLFLKEKQATGYLAPSVQDKDCGLEAFKLTLTSNSLCSGPKDSSLDRQSPIELIAWDIAKRFYLHTEDEKSYPTLYKKHSTNMPNYPIKRVKHGAMHVMRAAIAIQIFAELYSANLSPRDLKILQITALFHDAGRKSDTGGDQPSWEKHGKELCENYLKNHLGFSTEEITPITLAIENKDSKDTKNIYGNLLHDADCLEVIRSHNWHFNPSYLDFKPANRVKLDDLVKSYRQALAQMGDAPHEGNFNLYTKRKFEHNPSGYSLLQDLIYSHIKF